MMQINKIFAEVLYKFAFVLIECYIIRLPVGLTNKHVKNMMGKKEKSEIYTIKGQNDQPLKINKYL